MFIQDFPFYAAQSVMTDEIVNVSQLHFRLHWQRLVILKLRSAAATSVFGRQANRSRQSLIYLYISHTHTHTDRHIQSSMRNYTADTVTVFR